MMSTKFTTNQSISALPEPLTVLLQAAAQSVLRTLAARMRDRGFDGITEAHLILFGALDCGATHAAQIAQRMQVSRQAISKTLRELQSLDLLQLQEDPQRGNQKLVVMTERGMAFAREARGALQGMEAALAERIGGEAMTGLRQGLELGWGSTLTGKGGGA